MQGCLVDAGPRIALFDRAITGASGINVRGHISKERLNLELAHRGLFYFPSFGRSPRSRK